MMHIGKQMTVLGLAVFAGLVALPQALTAADAASRTNSKIKNVLFIVVDDLKASVIGAYGDKVCKTPNMDKLAKEGIVFNNAYCQGPVCYASRASFMFSRYQWTHTPGPSIGEHFIKNGWHSARVGKVYHQPIPTMVRSGGGGADHWPSWIESFNPKGKEHFTPGDYSNLNLNIFTREMEPREKGGLRDIMWAAVSTEGDGSDQPDYQTADMTIDLLRKHKDKPFFIATGMVRPHWPSIAPKRYFDLYPWQDIEVPEVPENDLDDIPKQGRPIKMNHNTGFATYPDNVKRMWQAYYATVTFMDEQLGRIIDELDRLGLRESTAIVFFSDHGYHLGEHTFWKKQNLHEEVSRVPLIVSVPGMKPGRTDAPTELVDLYPTLCELVGLPIPKEVQGTSFVQVLKDPSAQMKIAALTLRKGFLFRTKEFAYFQYEAPKGKEKGPEELYDMKKDPKQLTNVAQNPEYAPVLKKLQSQLDARIAEIGLLSAEELKALPKPEKPKKPKTEKVKGEKKKKGGE